MKKKVKPFQVINVLIMLFLIGITLYPMYYVVVASISDPILLKSHTGLLWKPLGEATLAGYQKTLANKSLFNGFKITLFYPAPGCADQLCSLCGIPEMLPDPQGSDEAHDFYHVLQRRTNPLVFRYQEYRALQHHLGIQHTLCGQRL